MQARKQKHNSAPKSIRYFKVSKDLKGLVISKGSLQEKNEKNDNTAKWQNRKIVLSWIYSRRSSLEAGSASLLSFPQKRSKTHSKTIIIIINRSTTDHHLPYSKDQRHSQQISHPTNPSSPQIPHLALALATNGQKNTGHDWQDKLYFILYCLFFAMH